MFRGGSTTPATAATPLQNSFRSQISIMTMGGYFDDEGKGREYVDDVTSVNVSKTHCMYRADFFHWASPKKLKYGRRKKVR